VKAVIGLSDPRQPLLLRPDDGDNIALGASGYRLFGHEDARMTGITARDPVQ
jgi:hypothetical protein